MNDLRPKRKRPVHMPPLERHNTPVILFVTLAVQPRGEFLANDGVHEAFRGACEDADAWSVGKYMIMPDHIHMFCSPARRPAVSVKRWSGYLKERITKRLNAALEGESACLPEARRRQVASRDREDGSAQLRPPSDGAGVLGGSAQPRPPEKIVWRWQPDCWDTQMRSGEHYHEKWEYVRQNPVRKGLVQRAEMWSWQGEMKVLRW